MAASVDVLVIGGGIIGLTAAIELADAGLSVTICDRAEFGKEASWAGAGIIPPGVFANAATPLDRLRAYGAEHYRAFAELLHDRTGIDCGYRQNGGIEILNENDEEEVVRVWKREGIACETLDDSELQTLEPKLSLPRQNAYLLSGMAQVRNPRLLRALVVAAGQSRVRMIPHDGVVDFERADHRVDLVEFASGNTIRASKIVIATGAWSAIMLYRLLFRKTVTVVRGQIVLYRADPSMLERTILDGKRYIVPRGDGLILAGSTEEETGFNCRTTKEGIASLMEFACGLCPELSRATIERTWAGLRPATDSNLPFIGVVPGYDNCYAATGHFRAGIQLAPGTARMLRELILKEPLTIDPTPFRLDRPPTPPGTLAFRS